MSARLQPEPRQPAAPDAPAGASASGAPARSGVRVLYTDDDAGLRSLVGRRLGRLGHAVRPAESGDEALRLLAGGEAVDVVVLDHAMPGKDGLETLAAIRARPNPPPVIFVTGQEDPRLAVTALKAGAVDYVVKDVAGEFIFLVDAAIGAAVERETLRREKELIEEEVRLARDRAERLAEERSLLLQEMNHRIANSLQLVAAMLHLQSSGAEDEGIRSALGEARERVFAVAQVHTRLYNSEDVQSVGMVEYLRALVGDLGRNAERARAEASERAGVAISLEADPIELSPDRAIAVGVIVTELVINALKHAFPDGSGAIAVALRQADDRLEITVADDGVGYREDLAGAPRRRGLGTRIIGAMLAKLDGTLERAGAGLGPSGVGTRVAIRFAAAAAPAVPEPA